MKRPTNFTQLTHENYILKIKYNELLNSHVLLTSQYNDLLIQYEENHPASEYIKVIHSLQNKNADLNRQILDNHKKNVKSLENTEIQIYTNHIQKP